jgi:hypothetical protein
MRKSKPTHTTPKTLFLVKPRQPEPPAELVEEALELWAHGEIAQFASDISDARRVWRKYRALVEAPDFPEFLYKHFLEEFECEPDREFPEPDIDVLACMESNTITPDAREQLLPDARKTAMNWLTTRVAG